MSHIIHAFLPQGNIELLRRVRAAVEAGAVLLIADFWTDEDHTDPPFAAPIAGELYRTFGGDVYSVGEATDWLERTARRMQAHRPPYGPTSFIEAAAV